MTHTAVMAAAAPQAVRSTYFAEGLLYYDKRALVPGPPWCSMHAKCVAVDGKRAFVSSANFTERGQERNIEVGVLLRDAAVAEQLAGHWLGLMEGGVLAERDAT